MIPPGGKKSPSALVFLELSRKWDINHLGVDTNGADDLLCKLLMVETGDAAGNQQRPACSSTFNWL